MGMGGGGGGGGGVGIRLGGARSPPSWRHGSARAVGKPPVVELAKTGRRERRTGRQIRDRKTSPKTAALQLGGLLRGEAPLRGLTAATEEETWLAFLLFYLCSFLKPRAYFTTEGQQRKHSRSEYCKLAGSLTACVYTCMCYYTGLRVCARVCVL